MIYSIVAYGDPVLKKKAQDIQPDYPELQKLIADMFETMYNANGVGLAAPQIGLSLRLFVVDGSPFDEEKLADFKKVFINARILESSKETSTFNEGCLSIPDIREDVVRPERIRMQWLDEHLQPQEAEFDGIPARIIQHEYDHIEGMLFTDRLAAFRRTLLFRKLDNISKGLIKVDYKMKFPFRLKRR